MSGLDQSSSGPDPQLLWSAPKEQGTPSLSNIRNLGYNILKNLDDELVRDKEISELGPCSECTNDILVFPLKAFTLLSCGHLFHRFCIEKKLLVSRPDVCPFPDCGKKVDIIYPVSSRRDSQSSQSSGTSALSVLLSEKFVLNSPVIPEDPMEGVQDTLIQETETRLTCAKCSEEITVDFTKDTVFLSCKHVVHYDCIDNPRKKCPTCPSHGSAQKKRSRESGASTEESSSKKAKKTSGKKVSSTLKQLIEELLTDVPVPTAEENLEEVSENGAVPEGPASIFLQLSNRIDNAETKNEDASRGLIFSYFDFGEAVFKRYKELKTEFGKDGSKALVKKEVRKAIPETRCSDEALRKKTERSKKMYKLFNSIGKEKIVRIRSIPPSYVSNLTKDEIKYVMAEILTHKV